MHISMYTIIGVFSLFLTLHHQNYENFPTVNTFIQNQTDKKKRQTDNSIQKCSVYMHTMLLITTNTPIGHNFYGTFTQQQPNEQQLH